MRVLVSFFGVGIFGWLRMLEIKMVISSVTVIGNSLLFGRYKSMFSKKKAYEKGNIISKNKKKDLMEIIPSITWNPNFGNC